MEVYFSGTIPLHAKNMMNNFVSAWSLYGYILCSAIAATNYPSLRDPPNGCQGHLRPCLSPLDPSMVTVRTRSTFIQLLA